MKLVLRGKNIPLTDPLRQYVEKRLGKLDKYLGPDHEAQVTLVVEKDRHRVEVTIPLNGIVLRGEEETGDMYVSIDQVIDKLERQVEKYRTRLAKKLKRDSLRDIVLEGLTEAEEPEPKVVKQKHISMKPMPVDEAIMQMNLVGHNFFVFTNAETNQVNVVYRRNDGDYGLIGPE